MPKILVTIRMPARDSSGGVAVHEKHSNFFCFYAIARTDAGKKQVKSARGCPKSKICGG